ncbi:hypothetical protein EON63_01155 [archaeon]|nr:MAG: hypothetical protein EON63_01155 [archaeon]
MSFARPWAVRTFKLKGQTLEYYDSSKLKGTIDIANGVAAVVAPRDADDKPFPFILDTNDKEKLILNASCDEIRARCIQIFNLAAKDANWTMPPEPGAQVAAAEEAIGLFAANAEKAKLEAEQKRLEEERLKEVTAATAKLMEEELANKQLREAEAAERKQREEQVS